MAALDTDSFSRQTSLRRSRRKPNSPYANIRQQLNDQLKCLEYRLDTEVAIVLEMEDFFKKISEIESEYGKNLERLVRQINTKHKTEKQKREHWPFFSMYTCWQNLLNITKKQGHDHNTLSEICNNQMVSRLQDIVENSQRIFKKCREVGIESHEDILKVLHELQNAMKTYHAYQAEAKNAEAKLQDVQAQKKKLEQQLQGKTGTTRSLKRFEHREEKRKHKYNENKLKALKARNDYLLCIESANAAINKYYSDDITDLMDCMNFGYHSCVARTMKMYLSSHEQLRNSHQRAIDRLNQCIQGLDARADKQKFLELHNAMFMLPKKFEYQPYKGDEARSINAVVDEMTHRCETLKARLEGVHLENDELWKTLETAENSLMKMISVNDHDVTLLFLTDNPPPPKSPHEAAKHKADRLETESYYLSKFKEYTLSCNRLARLQSKHNAIQKAAGEGINNSGTIMRPLSFRAKPRKRRIGRTPPVGQPKLFGGSLEEYIDNTGEEIPLIIRSCIRVINLHGIHHQGIFRVSGSQVEINEFKSSFEKGEDPLIDMVDASDINSVAGVLKLYFRELREPLFPLHLFDELINCTRVEDPNIRIEKIKELITTLPRSIFIVMRYLFAFLNHLSEYSDENMMDPYNLAICFGPTLLPIPPDRDQVSYQSNVNDLIKTIIINQEEIFLNDGGEVYEKWILDNQDNIDGNEEDEVGSLPSDEEASFCDNDLFEATALYDFEGRTERELSFKKGNTLVIFKQVSSDWWEGCFNGKEGLIPDKYVTLKTGREDKRNHSSSGDEDKHSSTYSLPLKPPMRQLSDDSATNQQLAKCMSQPNILIQQERPDSPKTSAQCPSSPKMHMKLEAPPLPMIRERVVKEHPVKEEKSEPPQPTSVTATSTTSTATTTTAISSSVSSEEVAAIEDALAKMMSGIKSLEVQQKTDKRMSLPAMKSKPTPKHTPDLVLDLPEGSDSPPSQENSEPGSPTVISGADAFAKSNQSTLKKGHPLLRTPIALNRHSAPEDTQPPGGLVQSSVIKRSFSTQVPGGRICPSPMPPAGLAEVPNEGMCSTAPPPIPEKPKVAMKAKPPVMRKPTKSPDPQRKFNPPDEITEIATTATPPPAATTAASSTKQ
ncbi:SLIT-ROBO Rho GTPase-activating protein 3 isoform X3 [Octopus sinensis]|uniref:SLIT-ROBO Rho GTPase-activating protein 3 isoform X3 n=1 Tax=Octopus sinensis TaxID=2607531 RepID=A0A6P7S8J6_9MOLL|nr:SLIT-ROBO Rho GTPase-activating protein 3 isoform X3 [Octopus sinensis]